LGVISPGGILMVSVMQRIAKMRRERKSTWLKEDRFVCPGCGMKFRYANNLKEHCKKCIDFKYGKQES